MPILSADDAVPFLERHRRGVLATLKADGRPQLSNVVYAVIDGRVSVSVTADRAKTVNLRRDPRVSLHVTSEDFWTYLVVEGVAQLSPVSAEPGDDTGRRLLRQYEAIAGPHPDPDEFLRSMVEDRRLEMSFAPERLYPLA